MKRSILAWLLVFSCIFISNVLVAIADDGGISSNSILNNNISNISIDNIQADQDQPITQTFIFDPIQNIKLDQSFNVKVYAYKLGRVDTSYNDTAMIEYCCGVLLNSPKEIKFIQGVGIVNNIKIKSGVATHAKMFLYEKGKARIKYYSNYFSVYNKDGSNEKNINTTNVNVKNIQKNNISNATIKLYHENNGTKITHTFYTDKNGNYKIKNIPSGVYLIYALYNDKESNKIYINIKDNTTSSVQLTINMCNTNITPVILIPGVAGSTTNVSTSNVVPVLPDNNSPLIYWKNFIHVNNIYGLHDPHSAVGWNKLITTLTNYKNKYTIGCNVFPMPYDWRLHPDDIVDKYLIPWINEIKKRTNTTKVNIVAHSMGGLIARAYIQSDRYNNDIDKLIMLGTPHYGSVNTYYLYDGGDPEKLDAIVHHINSVWLPSYTRNFYRDITNYMYFLYYNRAPNNNKEKRDLYRLHIPSLGVLMPTFPFIVYDNTNNNPVVSRCYFNTWLDTLNNSPSINRLNIIKSNIIMGTGYYTIAAIVTSNIQDCNRDTYTEGEPRIGDQYRLMLYGDSTVIENSTLPNINTIINKSNHPSLVSNNVSNIINLLSLSTSSQLSLNYIEDNVHNSEDVQIKQLNILINATNVSLEKNSINIILPDGKIIDIYDLFVDSDRDIKVSNINIHAEKINNTIMINIYTPNDGIYKLQLSNNTNILMSYITRDDTIDVSKDNVNNIDFTIINNKLYAH